MPLEIGDRFHVRAAYDVKNAKGQVLTTYRPEFDYPVTARNRDVVERMIAEGAAARGGRPAGARVTPAMRLSGARGRATTGKPPQDQA